ncbi:MAG: helix-turn-helix domain-containing protein [Paracoccaceae bacterium]
MSITRHAQQHKEAWDVLLNPAEASGYLKVSTSKLAKLRMVLHRGDGPTFIKIGGTVLYRRKDLEKWLEDHTVRADA